MPRGYSTLPTDAVNALKSMMDKVELVSSQTPSSTSFVRVDTVLSDADRQEIEQQNQEIDESRQNFSAY